MVWCWSTIKSEGLEMTAVQIFKDGKCGDLKPIRLKVWASGYSLKCFKGKRTSVVRPFDVESLSYDLATFCDRCDYKKC